MASPKEIRDFGHEWAAVELQEAVLPRSFKAPELPSGYSWSPAGESVRPNSPPAGELVFFVDQFKYGLSLPLSEEVKSICREMKIIPTMITPNGYSIIQGMITLFKHAKVRWSVRTFTWFMSIRGVGGFCYFTPRKKYILHTEKLPSSLSGWKLQYFCVRLPAGEEWGIPLTPERTPEDLYTPSIEPVGAYAVMEWLASRSCTLYLASPFEPDLIFGERGSKEPAQAKGASTSQPGAKRKKALAHKNKKKMKVDVNVPPEGHDDVHGEGVTLVIPISEKVKAAAAPPQAPQQEKSGDERRDSVNEEGGDLAAPSYEKGSPNDSFIRWVDDRKNSVVLSPIPRQDRYEVSGESSEAYEALQIISSAQDWNAYKKHSLQELSYMAAGHVLNAAQITDYLGHIATTSSKKANNLKKIIKDKDEEKKKEVQELKDKLLAAGEREKEYKSQLKQAKAQKDAEIAGLRKSYDEAMQSLALKAQETTDSLQSEVKVLKATIAAHEAQVETVQSPEAAIESFRKSREYAEEIFRVCTETFTAGKNFLVASDIVPAEKVSQLTYADVEKWLLRLTGIPPL